MMLSYNNAHDFTVHTECSISTILPFRGIRFIVSPVWNVGYSTVWSDSSPADRFQGFGSALNSDNRSKITHRKLYANKICFKQGGKKQKIEVNYFRKPSETESKQNASWKVTVIIILHKWFIRHESDAVTKSNNSLLLMIMSGE